MSLACPPSLWRGGSLRSLREKIFHAKDADLPAEVHRHAGRGDAKNAKEIIPDIQRSYVK